MKVEAYIAELAEKYGLTVLKTKGIFFPPETLPADTRVTFNGSMRHGGGTPNWVHSITDSSCSSLIQPITYATVGGNCEDDGLEIAIDGLDIDSYVNSSPGRKALLGSRVEVYGRRDLAFRKDSPMVRYLLENKPEVAETLVVHQASKEEAYLLRVQLRRVALHMEAFEAGHHINFYEFFLPHLARLGKSGEKKVKVERSFNSNGRIISEE